MSEVIMFPGQEHTIPAPAPAPAAREPNQKCIEVLEHYLELARSGELQGVGLALVLVGEDDVRRPGYRWCALNSSDAVTAMVAATSTLDFRFKQAAFR